MVTWSQQDAGDWNVWARRYDAAGNSGGQRRSWSTTRPPDVQRYSTVAMDAAGDFTIVWQSNNQDGSGYGIYAASYAAASQTSSGEFLVNDTTAGDQILPDVAMDASGAFVVTWTSIGQDGDPNKYLADGVTLNPDYDPNAASNGGSTPSNIALAAKP